jgi:hypothetical protein
MGCLLPVATFACLPFAYPDLRQTAAETIGLDEILTVCICAIKRTRFDSEMVGCGSGQGRSDVETAGVAALRRGFQHRENAGPGHKMPFMNRN